MNKLRKIKSYIIEILLTILGAMIMAIGTSLFLLPNQLSTGGFSGIATITYYVFNIPMGTTIFLLNLPLFIFSTLKIGKKFLVKTIIGTVSLSIFIDIFDKLTPLTTDIFLACIYGGIITGIGLALVLKEHSSTGGTDLISNILRQYRPMIRMSNIIVILDIIIVILNIMFLKNIEIGLYSAIAIYLMGKMIDIITEGIYFTKLLLIISDKNEEISKNIEFVIKRGVTGVYGKGMYTGKDKLVLICAVGRKDFMNIKRMIKKIDPNSFIIITNAREVLGMGFKEN